MAVSWRIYYADGSTHSGSGDEAAMRASGVGVLCIAQRDKGVGGKEILHGDGPRVVDWYWWEGGSWLCGDMAGLVQYLAASTDPQKILVGRNVPNGLFREAMARASEDDLA